MKSLFNVALLAICLLSSTISFAQEDGDKEKKKYEHQKQNDISKTDPATGNTLHIENSFGAVKVSTWDKNEIKVDIHIETTSPDAAHAEDVFNRISVDNRQEGKNIYFKTKISDQKNNCNNCKNSMEINYEIHIPSSNALEINNSFGKIEIPDYKGSASLSSKFGSLTTGDLANVEKVNVEFGKAVIKSMNNIDAVFKFSKVEVGSLGGSSKVHMEFCTKSRIGLSSSLSSLDVVESYSTLNLRPADNLSASFDVSTSFGTLIDHSNANIKRTDTPDEYGPDADKHYSGKAGSGSAKISIRSSFGKIIIGEASEEEMKEKPKDKNKRPVSV